LAESRLATILKPNGPEKPVAIPSFLGVCELKSGVAVVPVLILAAVGVGNLQWGVSLVLDLWTLHLSKTAACQREK
jgi:hypothetical protein